MAALNVGSMSRRNDAWPIKEDTATFRRLLSHAWAEHCRPVVPGRRASETMSEIKERRPGHDPLTVRVVPLRRKKGNPLLAFSEGGAAEGMMFQPRYCHLPGIRRRSA